MKALPCLILLLALGGCSDNAPSTTEATATSSQTKPAEPAEQTEQAAAELPTAEGQASLRLAIEGMHCGGCANGVAKRLRAVEGVADCSVSFDSGQAVVVYDPAITDAEALAAASIDGTDYAVSPLP